MAKKQGFVRTTISVPSDLKRRMGKVDVNWSGVACRAFEDTLTNIASRKQVQNMNDVIERLRQSEKSDNAEAEQAGREAGEAWVKETAQVAELKRLERAWNGYSDNDRHYMFAAGPGNAYSAAELLVFVIQPENDGVRGSATDFWEGIVDNIEETEDPAFMEGFITGALELWGKLKSQL